jgi:hypothetical protein
MSTDSFLRREMVNVRAGHAQAAVFFGSAACACAVFLNRSKVFCITSVFEIEDAGGCNGIAESLSKKVRQRLVS